MKPQSGDPFVINGMVTWKDCFKSQVRSCHVFLQIYRELMSDSRTPRISRVLLGIAVSYALSPVVLIPDFIPVIGHLDDLIIIPALLLIAFWFIPSSLKDEFRLKTANEPDSRAGGNHGAEME